MSKSRSFLRPTTRRGLLVVMAVALFGVAGPASAQFFDFGFGRPQPRQQHQQPRGGGGGFFPPFSDVFGPGPQQQQQPARPADFSRAPAPAKREAPADRNVLVLGDAMADWLAYGLEDALAETPELGVIRKHKTVSGLLKYQPKGEPSDWAAAAKGILAAEKPDVIVVMLGLHDRIPMREPVVEKKADAKTGEKTGDKADKKTAKKDAATPGDHADGKHDSADAGHVPDDEEDQPHIMAPEKAARSANGVYEFRDERWVELYTKKIEEMIAVLKSKGVPVLWVGLPAVRGTKATADALFLDALYRDAAAKAGITYVDVWDGFVDETGRFAQQGPDFEGQIRRLRTSDGVYFTKAGARKLALYTEREIRRVLAARSGPVALPSESFAPDSNLRPGEAGPRPIMGPIMPLVASSVGTTELLGGAGSRPASVDALAARTMVKGEALEAPAGRADDYSWPRREVGSLSAPPSDPVVVTTSPDGAAVAVKPKPKRAPHEGSLALEGGSAPHPRPTSREVAPRPPAGFLQPGFGFGNLFSRW
jgi:hypothetical protein